MKKLTMYGLALILVAGTSAALAESRHGGGHHGGRHYQPRGHHGSYYRPYRHPAYYRGYYRPSYYYPSFLGAALVGSALTSSLYHSHNGSACYESHSSSGYQQQSGNYSEVVGCHRIERLADGSERRVEVPLSQCR